MTKEHTKRKRYSTGPQVRARYGDISAMALHRWIKKGLVPPPTYINGKMYFDDDELDERDRARASQPRIIPENHVSRRRAKAEA